MTIRPEAVKAAELVARDVFEMWRWADLDHNESREFFTGILEAAAPYMQADAWDAAIDAAYERRVIGDTSSDALKLDNPYRRPNAV